MNDRPPSMLLIYALTITGVTVNTLVAPSTPDILDGLDAPRSAAGLLLAAASFPGIVLAPVIGVLADRYGRRAVLVPCLVIFGVAGGAVSVAPELWVVVVLRLIQGVGSAGLINLAVVLIGDHWTGAERSARIGRNAAVLTVAVAVFPALGGVLTDVVGWRGTFLVYPLALLTALAAARGLPAATAPGRTLREQLGEVGPVLRRPRVIVLLGVGVVLFAVMFGAVFTILPLHAERDFGLGASYRGIIVGLPSVTSTLASLRIAKLERWLGRPALLASAWVLLATALAAMAWAPGVVWLAAAVLLFGFGQGVVFPVLQDIAASTGPDTSRGSVVAAWVSAVRLGQTTGPVLGSSGFGTLGARPSLALGAVAAAAMVPSALIARRTPQRTGPSETVGPV